MLIQFMCLDFIGRDSDVLWPDSVTQAYVVVVLWLTFIITLGWMCHFGFWGLATSSAETISWWYIRHRPWKPNYKNEIWSSHLPVGNRCSSQKPRTLYEIIREVKWVIATWVGKIDVYILLDIYFIYKERTVDCRDKHNFFYFITVCMIFIKFVFLVTCKTRTWDSVVVKVLRY